MRERIGSYRIEGVLDEGGMGLVYKGRHDSLGRYAAIKTLLPKHAGDAALRQRLLREAQAQASLQHSGIVAVYDFIDDDEELFIAMELVDGRTLEATLESLPRNRMPLAEVLPLFDQVLDALEYVHGERIIHRDVKPSNVMVCGGRAKLVDFGIALLADSARITVSGQMVGSPQYMSPEQLEAKSIDHRSDIYSAALVLYRMLAGRPAFESKEYFAQVHDRLAGPPDLRTLVPELSAGFCDAVAIALRYDREERFPSVAEFRDALREGAAGFNVPGPRSIDTAVVQDAEPEPLVIALEPEPRRSTAIVWLVIAGTFVAALGVVVGQIDRHPFPVQAPRQNIASATAPPTAVIIEASTPPIVPRKPDAPAGAEPRKPKIKPFLPTAKPVEDEEANRRRELDALREAIARGLGRAEANLRAENFAAAIEEIDRIAEMVQRRPADLVQERVEIAQLRERVLGAQVADRTRRAQDALWASRLADIEEDLRAQRWPEAERFAAGIIRDPLAPGAVADRAEALLQRAKEGRKSAFKDTQLGPTTNTIRKPSSPPGK